MTRNPFEEIERMFERMGRQFEGLDDEVFGSRVAVDVKDADDAYVVTADLPGFDTDEIDVELAGETLTLSATHEEATERDDADGRYLRRERRRRSVNRSVQIPEPVDEAGTEAEYRNGVLTVRLPKQEPDGGQTIPVN